MPVQILWLFWYFCISYIRTLPVIVLREGVQKNGDFSQTWVGGVADSQTRSKPLQTAPKIALFDPNFTFRFPKSHENPGVGGWVNRFGKGFQKKNVFFGSFLIKDIMIFRTFPYLSAQKSTQGPTEPTSNWGFFVYYNKSAGHLTSPVLMNHNRMTIKLLMAMGE